VVRGHLYKMPSGIPVLRVPEADILAHGTVDPLADVATQARFAGELASYLEPTPESATAGDWGSLHGELLTFDDPETRLPAIDRLEGFHPGGPSLYRRVLVPVCIPGQISPAWVYVGVPKHWARRSLPNGTWPEYPIEVTTLSTNSAERSGFVLPLTALACSCIL